MEHGKNSRQKVHNQSGYVCSIDYIEQCRRFSSLTWWSFAFDCVCRHTNTQRTYRRVSTTRRQLRHLKSIAIIRSHRQILQWAQCEWESNEIHSNFWQIHNNWNQDHRRAIAIIAISEDLCAFFYDSILLALSLFFSFWIFIGGGYAAVTVNV